MTRAVPIGPVLTLVSPKHPAQSYISYMRSILLQKNKEIFDVHALPAEVGSVSLEHVFQLCSR